MEKRSREELNHVLKTEEVMWAQNAKVNWLNLGDKNAKCFQTIAMVHKKRNEITRISDSTGL